MLGIKDNYKLHNEYHIEVYDTEAKQIRQVVDTTNVVTDRFRQSLNSVEKLGWGYMKCHLGTGAGTPSGTDTGMFAYLSSITQTSTPVVIGTYPNAERTFKFTVSAEASIGVISEIGLYYSTYQGWPAWLATHAMLTDAEGNPITINKTATDILYITIKLNYTQTVGDVPGKNTSVFIVDDMYNPIYNNFLVGCANPSTESGSIQLKVYGSPYKCAVGINVAEHTQMPAPLLGTIAFGTNGVANGIGLPLLYTTCAAYGGTYGYSIKSIAINNLASINVTPEIFPPMAFPKYQLGIGDGTNKEFYNKTQNSIVGTQKVYIDGALKTEGVDYTYHPDNAKDFYCELVGANSLYCTASGELGYSYLEFGPWYPAVSLFESYRLSVDASNPISYDFLAPVQVNAVKVDGDYGYAGVYLQYSTDNITWNTVFTLTTSMAGSIQYFTEVSARYWRWASSTLKNCTRYVNYNANATAEALINSFIFAFGLIKPNVVFTTAPAANAVIEIEYDIPYPIHNSLHSVTLDVTATIQS